MRGLFHKLGEFWRGASTLSWLFRFAIGFLWAFVVLGVLALDIGSYTGFVLELSAGLAIVLALSTVFGVLIAFGTKRAWYALEALLER